MIYAAKAPKRRDIRIEDDVRELLLRRFMTSTFESPWMRLDVKHIHHHMPLYTVEVSSYVVLLAYRTPHTSRGVGQQNVPTSAYV